MEFRPCIDIHNGKVKQIVGGSLRDEGSQARENFVSEQDAAFYAGLYQRQGIRGGHVILLNKEGTEYFEATRQQALSALRAYPGGLQIGGGIRDDNAADCFGIYPGRSKPCDRDFLCVPGWTDELEKSEETGNGSGGRSSGSRCKLQKKRRRLLYCHRPLAEVYGCSADTFCTGRACGSLC